MSTSRLSLAGKRSDSFSGRNVANCVTRYRRCGLLIELLSMNDAQKRPIVFGPRVRVERHSELANDFIRRVLQLDWAWISDQSSLWDFHTDVTNDKFIEQIRLIYGVDVSDLENGNLADIFDRISLYLNKAPD